MQLLDKALSLDEVGGRQVAARVPQPVFLDQVAAACLPRHESAFVNQRVDPEHFGKVSRASACNSIFVACSWPTHELLRAELVTRAQAHEQQRRWAQSPPQSGDVFPSSGGRSCAEGRAALVVGPSTCCLQENLEEKRQSFCRIHIVLTQEQQYAYLRGRRRLSWRHCCLGGRYHGDEESARRIPRVSQWR